MVESSPKIVISDLAVEFIKPDQTKLPVLENIDLTIGDGDFVTLIGASGCGKSTLLNIIANLIPHNQTAGEVDIHWNNTEQKNLGYIFQKDVLLPWKTVLDNVKVGLEIKGVPPKERENISREWLDKVDLSGYEDVYPSALSGGMRQRVSIIRTLAYDPEIILMDEPFGALDAQTRMNLQEILLKLWEETKKTIIFVTHDLEESVLLGKKVVLLGSRPTGVRQVYDIPLSYPRNPETLRFDPTFQDLTRTIWRDLRTEINQAKES